METYKTRDWKPIELVKGMLFKGTSTGNCPKYLRSIDEQRL